MILILQVQRLSLRAVHQPAQGHQAGEPEFEPRPVKGNAYHLPMRLQPWNRSLEIKHLCIAAPLQKWNGDLPSPPLHADEAI